MEFTNCILAFVMIGCTQAHGIFMDVVEGNGPCDNVYRDTKCYSDNSITPLASVKSEVEVCKSRTAYKKAERCVRKELIACYTTNPGYEEDAKYSPSPEAADEYVDKICGNLHLVGHYDKACYQEVVNSTTFMKCLIDRSADPTESSTESSIESSTESFVSFVDIDIRCTRFQSIIDCLQSLLLKCGCATAKIAVEAIQMPSRSEVCWNVTSEPIPCTSCCDTHHPTALLLGLIVAMGGLIVKLKSGFI